MTLASNLLPLRAALDDFDAADALTEQATEKELHEARIESLMRTPLVELYQRPMDSTVAWVLLARCASAIPAVNAPCLPRMHWVVPSL